MPSACEEEGYVAGTGAGSDEAGNGNVFAAEAVCVHGDGEQEA
jgi:hypothetical protein